jgi:hypothetical protein
MEFHHQAMSHVHLLESKLKPEMTVKPSALWQKRNVVTCFWYIPLYLTEF